MSVVVLQGEAATTVLNMIDKDGPAPAIHHLSQCDFSDDTLCRAYAATSRSSRAPLNLRRSMRSCVTSTIAPS